MATVVSHAMRRFASTPDANFSSCGLRSENPRWSQENESSLSRSMRYADPWLYDSVRGSPNGLLLAPALVLCSCPDYLNGTKRSSKKTPTTCKKCKATRLPFPSGDSKFGTVRCFPSASLAQTPPTRAGTVRVTSSSRPSILPAADPYDLMRRSRLSVTESPNQFRARSVSPSKARSDSKKQKPKYSTVGRRSILECHVNPYDLMSTGHEEKDSSITLVNGQRIRVRPPICEPDYEDVQVRKSQIPKPSKMKPKTATSSSPKPNEKESESNRFKSILKKPTATFSDTDSSHGPERSPSPAHKTGSHFYLPLPTSPPRKKVQFLVGPAHSKTPLTPPPPPSSPPPPPPIKKEIKPEKELFYDYKETVDPIEDFYDYNEDLNDEVFYDCNDVADTPKAKEQTEFYEEKKVVEEQHINLDAKEEEASLPKPQTDKNKHAAAVRSCKLRRCESERLVKDRSRRIVFCDSMALRGKAKKTDSRIIFTAEDLERLDGITNAKLSMIKPEEPPPEPQKEVEVKEEVKCEIKEEVKVEVKKDVEFEIKKEVKEEMPPSAPPRKRNSRIREEKLEDEDKVQIKTYQEADKILIKTDYHAKEKNRTILQINACEPSVHKLKIKNEFPETNNINTISISDNHLGKTSIMINGDDCYSTIKVCDEIPLYHSSVVVKDSGIVIENKKSSTVYITGNFVNTFVEEKTLPETKETMNDDIFKCLNDPVEAVRLNLVPHVCGKAHVKNTQPILDTLTEEEKVKKFIEESFIKLRNNNILEVDDKDICSEHSSSTQYEIMDHGSECYTDHSNRSSITEEELNARTKFYELLADSAIVEVSESEDHHYESIKLNPDPIYEEIEIPPPLPANPPPSSIMDDLQLDKEYTTRSIFEGASKYDILSYLVDAKERGIIPEDSYTYNFGNSDVVIEEESKETNETPYNRVSHLSTVSDSSEDSSLVMPCSLTDDKRNAEIERNDSGVGSETSKSSLSKYRSKPDIINICCEDCEVNLEPNTEHEPLVCRKCIKKRTERKEIITEIVETEEKYSRDLQIILEEFYQPMLVAGLLTSDQLSAIFLNAEELLENSQALAERLRDAVEIAADQGDEDLQTVNIGKLFLEAAPMLHGFETYCVRQGPASLLLASLEKEKELLRIFLRVSQMENTVLRRMNLNSFLMVPVQRVTKYPLLLARLYKVTPTHHETREQLKEAQHKIELHLSHMNSETKDVPSKLWRRISSIPGRRSSSEMDLVNIKLRKIAVDVLEWNHDEAKFALEGRLLFTQPTDNNWRKGRTIKLTPVNALLVTNGKSTSTRNDPTDDSLVFSRQAGIRDAALLLVRDKNGRYTLLREPLYLDRCVIAADPAWQSYFEVQELLGKDTFIFKAEDEEQTKVWYKQLQYYAQGMGAWRKRRNALANIMINGMGLRS